MIRGNVPPPIPLTRRACGDASTGQCSFGLQWPLNDVVIFYDPPSYMLQRFDSLILCHNIIPYPGTAVNLEDYRVRFH